MYDLIIVGAGTAGCVLAERLSASGKLSILLIEAGGPPTNRFVAIPAGFSRLFKTDHDWNFESEPQSSAGGGRIFTPRGKMLGGSSNMNAQVHQWCHPADFEEWAAAGASGWGWKDVAPVFRSQERWLGDDGDPDRGYEGPMVISPNRNVLPLSRAFVDAARRAGLGNQPQYNGKAFEGAWLCEIAHKDGKRFSAYNAYLQPAMKRKNLEVVTDAHATDLVFEGGRAAGVRAIRGGTEATFKARGVVLVAGAFGSPQLLMHSGIGPAAALGEFGIPVRLDAPEVGANLQDHPVLPIVFKAQGTDTFKSAESPLSLLKYIFLKRGMLASNGIEAFAFKRVHPTAPAAPDLELIFAPLEVRRQFLEPPQVHAFGIASAVVAPRSRGRVFLKSVDPRAPLGIDFGLLTDPEGVDAAVMLEGIRLARKIAATAPLDAENAGELRPGADASELPGILARSVGEFQTVYHPSCTCRMGSDARSVVDPQLRVRGVDGLWVADASVMPSVVRGHPNAAVAMIGHRAAEWIGAAVGG